MEGVLAESLRILKTARAKSASINVAFSAGKDSLAVIDLCSRTFDRIDAFFMEMVPGLECVEVGLAWAEQHYGVKVRRYPHWILGRCLKGGIYCNNWLSTDDIPDVGVRDIYNAVIADTGIPLIATGAKRKDSIWRKRGLSNNQAYDDVVYPIVGWNKLDVLSFLKMRNIPIPSSSGASATGVDLSTPSLLWLHDTYPADFAKVCEVFPYAQAVVFRRTFYGMT